MSNDNYGNAARYSGTPAFQRIAAELGYIQTRGGGAAAGIGSAKRLFAAIESGEVVCVKAQTVATCARCDETKPVEFTTDPYQSEINDREVWGYYCDACLQELRDEI